MPYPITPVRVVEAFAERGETVNVEQIRIALNRLAKDGGLTKVGPSLFAVPGTRPTELHTMPRAAGEPVCRGPGAAREGPARAGCQPERVSTNAPELVLVDDVAATLDSVHLDDGNPGAIATLEVAARGDVHHLEPTAADRLDDIERRPAEVTSRSGVDDDASHGDLDVYGYSPRVVVASATRWTASP